MRVTPLFSREISSLFKQATMAGAKPQPEERSLFKKNRDILTLNQPPSSTYLGMVWKIFALIRGVIFNLFPHFAAISPLSLFPPFGNRQRDKNVQNVSQNSPILQQFRRYHYFHLLWRDRVPQNAAIWPLSLFPPSREESPPFCSNFAIITISTFYI